jgi:hypothetical protein
MPAAAVDGHSGQPSAASSLAWADVKNQNGASKELNRRFGCMSSNGGYHW